MTNRSISLHSIHPYPCKFPPQVVQAHLPRHGVVLDPYCGSGTTLLEAAIHGLDVIGIDCNPIATLITRCKLISPSTELVQRIEQVLNDLALFQSEPYKYDIELHDFAGRDHWFTPAVQREIAFVLRLLNQFDRNSDEWIIVATSLSSIVNVFSNQDSETRYVAVSKAFSEGDLVSSCVLKIRKVLNAIKDRGALSGTHLVLDGDLRDETDLPKQNVDVVITSPPYANTMDYYLYHKQRMNILGFDFRETQSSEIGSRYQFSSKKEDPITWEQDYVKGMSTAMATLKPGGVAWFIIGDSQIGGNLIDGGKLTLDSAEKLGFRAEIVESVPMAGKSRLFRSSFQRPNKFEHVVKLTK